MMKLLPALLLALAPSLAFAECGHGQKEATMSCAEGLQLDQATRTCVPVTG